MNAIGKKQFLLLCMFFLAATWRPFVVAQHAHVHGSATLQVAVDGPTLTVHLASPLEGLLGFERAPRTAKETAAAADLMARLRKPEAWFVPTPAASCSVASASVVAPVLEQKGGGDGHGYDEHAELTADYVFRCAHPDALRGLEVKLFESFRRLHRVQAQLVGPKGQSAATLTPARRLLAW